MDLYGNILINWQRLLKSMLISVVVPVYKVEEYLNRCVDSILKQTFTDFELILVDDGSPDSCGKICDEYAKKDDRVTVIHKQNGGLSDARNAGIEWALQNSNSEWITFIDSDDWVHKDYLKLLYKAVKETHVDVSVCRFVRTTGEDDLSNERNDASVKLWSPEDFFVEDNVNAIVAWGKLYRKSLWKDIRYPYGRIHEDEFTTYKLLFHKDKIAVVDKVMYYYFTNPNGIMNKMWTPKRLDAIDAFESRIDYFKDNNYKKAYELNINMLIMFYYGAFTRLSESDDIENKRKYIKTIRKRFNKQYKMFKNDTFVNKDQLEFVYATISPVRCYINTHIKALIRKFK